MQTLQQILPDVFYVGASEGRHPLFENIYPVPNGMSYNSYLITDSKTALLDTCDSSVREQFLSNLETGRAIVFSQGYSKALQVQIRKRTDTDAETKIKDSDKILKATREI